MSDERELTEFESRLRAARPAHSALDRDRLLFLAGAASAQPVRAARPRWVAVTTLAAAVLAGAATGWWFGARSGATSPSDDAQVRPTVAGDPAPPSSRGSSSSPTVLPEIAMHESAVPTTETLMPPLLLAARQQVLNHGVESWDAAPASFTPPDSSPLTSGAASIDESSPTY